MPVAPPRFYEIDDLRIDTVRRVVERAGMLLPISPKAFDVLLVLVEKAGEVISKDELLTLVWPDTVVEEANLTQKIFHLRRVLGEKRTDHRYLVTVPGRGYRFVASVKPTAESATSTTTEPASVTGMAEMSAP
ncbi:MAG TPA: transcriptional regulator, partial [Acidobacteriota bacterium]|nr:transcriptional regulator [Acidobacteriota bacterium]